MKNVAYFLLALAAGTVAAFVRLALAFFPALNVMEFLLFSGGAAVIVGFRPRGWWLWVPVFIAPAMLFVARTVHRLGPENLNQGIGTAHAASVVVIPVAAVLGGGLMYLFQRMVWRRSE
jgi:hypothetical protein